MSGQWFVDVETINSSEFLETFQSPMSGQWFVDLSVKCSELGTAVSIPYVGSVVC